MLLCRLCVFVFQVGTPCVILDAPTLYETKRLLPVCALVVVVATSAQLQLDRLMARNSLTRKEAMDRIRSQLPLADKVNRADRVRDHHAAPSPRRGGSHTRNERPVIDAVASTTMRVAVSLLGA